MANNLKVITIDFWNTLFDSSNGMERNQKRIEKLKNAFSELGLDITEEQYQKAMEDAWQFFNGIWKNQQRTLTTYESVKFFWEYFNAPYDEDLIEDVVEFFEKSILYQPPNLNEGVRESLEILSQKYKLAIISDTGFSPGSVLRELMENVSILRYFSAFSFSNETGVAKPHPRAYLKVLEELNCPNHLALHIGDIEETDILGAKSLNMYAIRFVPNHLDLFNDGEEIHTQADFLAKKWLEIPKLIEKIENAS